MLMALWKCYENLGKKQQFEAAYLMGEKISSLYLKIENSLKSKKLML